MAVTTTYDYNFVQNIVTDMPFSESAPSAISLSGGGFAVAVTETQGGVSQTYVAAYDAGGAIIDSVLVGGTDADIAQLTDGRLVIASMQGDALRLTEWLPGGSEATIATITDPGTSAPRIAALKDGGFVVATQDNFATDDNDIDIRIFNGDGSLRSQFTVLENSADDRAPSISVRGNENVFLTWTRRVGTGSEIWQATYGPDGSTVSAPAAYSAIDFAIDPPSPLALASGGIALVYQTSDGSDPNLLLVASDAQFSYQRLITRADSTESSATTALMSNGMIAVAYQEDDDGPNDLDAHIMLVDTATGDVLADRLFNATSGNESNPAIAAMSGGRIAAFSEVSGGNVEGQIFEAVRTSSGDEFDNRLDGDGLRDVMRGNAGGDTLYGAGNADDLAGGAGDDVFEFEPSEVMAGEEIDGGADFDTITTFFNSGAKSVDFTEAASITGIEQITIAGDVIFTAAQIKGLPANLRLNNALSDVQATLRIAMGDETTLDLSGLQFATWRASDRVEVIGDDDDETITGTTRGDFLLGNGGVDLFLYSSGALLGPLDTIDGGDGLDSIRFTSTTAGDKLVLSPLITSVEIIQISNALGSSAGTTALTLDASALGYGVSLFGNAGTNTITGTGFIDIIDGFTGADTIVGGLGADEMTGGDDNDIFLIRRAAEHGNGETILGGQGTDRIRFTSTTAGETLVLSALVEEVEVVEITSATGSAAGTTSLSLDASSVGAGLELRGNAGSNRLTGTAFGDVIYGNSGSDDLRGGGGADFLSGGDGVDTANYATSSAGVSINLTTKGHGGGDAQGDVLSSIENVIGSNFVDKLTGDAGVNRLDGGGDNDTLSGRGGADVLVGGIGTDTASYSASLAGVRVNLTTNINTGGDAEGDSLYGIENLIGSNLADTLSGNAGVNRLDGGDDDDTLAGRGGADVLIGGAGNDTASYGTSLVGIRVNLTTNINTGGDAEGDSLSGIENLTGSNLKDTLSGNAGVNRLDGGGDNDTFGGRGGADVLIGGAGSDTSSYAASLAGVTVNLTTNINTGGDAQGDSLSSIENLIGSNLADKLTGSAGVNRIEGGAGTDTLAGLGGADVLIGGTETDTASYAGSLAAVKVNLTTNVNTGGDAQGDSLSSIENLIGSNLADKLTGSAGVNRIEGGAGADTLAGLGGADVLIGGTEADTASYAGSLAAVKVNLTTNVNTGGDAQGDSLSSIENLIGSNFADTLSGNAGINRLDGGGSDDTFGGRGGADVLIGGAGSDTSSYAASLAAVKVSLTTGINTGGDAEGDSLSSIENLIGSNFADTLSGDAGINRLDGGADNDLLSGRGGADVLIGGAGSDTATYIASVASVTVNLATNVNTGGDAQGDSLSSIENLIGSNRSDRLTGNTGVNRFDGGLGNDTLTGGGNADTFAFTTAPGTGNIDAITDFTVGSDLIALSTAIYASLGSGPAPGQMAASSFRLSTQASTSGDLGEIIYNATTGALIYDLDGTGGGAAKQFATVSAGLALSASSFRLV